MKKGCFYSHQGWTDIINSLPLINYYAKKYDELVVLMREDANPIVNYYVNGIDNVKLLYLPVYLLNQVEVPDDYEKLFHGYSDKKRTDKYYNVFNEDTRLNMHIARGFYEFYDIPQIEKINSFNLNRNIELEEKEYNNFISIYGKDYIVYHMDENSTNRGVNMDFLRNEKAINLSQKTSNIFSYLKIIKESREIHLVDSIWAAMCYLVDYKYNYFENKIINIYPFHNIYGGLLDLRLENKELLPLHKENWKIHI